MHVVHRRFLYVADGSKLASDYLEPTPEMVDFFQTRTKEHIDRVKKYMALFDGFDASVGANELAERAEQHDADKYDPEMVVPYIWVTEYYRLKNDDQEIPDDVQRMYDLSREATGKHIQVNRHHPEAHDKPTSMSVLDLVEMVCDWAAMSEELGEGSPRGWADKNVGEKWVFDDDQVKTIYSAIDLIENLS